MTMGYVIYLGVAALVFAIGVATQPQPRSVVVMALAAALWPFAMLAVAAQVWLFRGEGLLGRKADAAIGDHQPQSPTGY